MFSVHERHLRPLRSDWEYWSKLEREDCFAVGKQGMYAGIYIYIIYKLACMMCFRVCLPVISSPSALAGVLV